MAELMQSFSANLWGPTTSAKPENDQEPVIENKEIVLECDFDGLPDSNPLYRAIEKNKWGAARMMLNRNSELEKEAENSCFVSPSIKDEIPDGRRLSKAWITRKNPDGTVKWRLTVLHGAVLFGAPTDILCSVLDSHRPAVSFPDDCGNLPLHLAFRKGISEDKINLFLEAYPQGMDMKNDKGMTPLDCVCRPTSQSALMGYLVATKAKHERELEAERSLFVERLGKVEGAVRAEQDEAINHQVEASVKAAQKVLAETEERLKKELASSLIEEAREATGKDIADATKAMELRMVATEEVRTAAEGAGVASADVEAAAAELRALEEQIGAKQSTSEKKQTEDDAKEGAKKLEQNSTENEVMETKVAYTDTMANTEATNAHVTTDTELTYADVKADTEGANADIVTGYEITDASIVTDTEPVSTENSISTAMPAMSESVMSKAAAETTSALMTNEVESAKSKDSKTQKSNALPTTTVGNSKEGESAKSKDSKNQKSTKLPNTTVNNTKEIKSAKTAESKTHKSNKKSKRGLKKQFTKLFSGSKHSKDAGAKRSSKAKISNAKSSDTNVPDKKESMTDGRKSKDAAKRESPASTDTATAASAAVAVMGDVQESGDAIDKKVANCNNDAKGATPDPTGTVVGGAQKDTDDAKGATPDPTGTAVAAAVGGAQKDTDDAKEETPDPTGTAAAAAVGGAQKDTDDAKGETPDPTGTASVGGAQKGADDAKGETPHPTGTGTAAAVGGAQKGADDGKEKTPDPTGTAAAAAVGSAQNDGDAPHNKPSVSLMDLTLAASGGETTADAEEEVREAYDWNERTEELHALLEQPSEYARNTDLFKWLQRQRDSSSATLQENLKVLDEVRVFLKEEGRALPLPENTEMRDWFQCQEDQATIRLQGQEDNGGLITAEQNEKEGVEPSSNATVEQIEKDDESSLIAGAQEDPSSDGAGDTSKHTVEVTPPLTLSCTLKNPSNAADAPAKQQKEHKKEYDDDKSVETSRSARSRGRRSLSPVKKNRSMLSKLKMHKKKTKQDQQLQADRELEEEQKQKKKQADLNLEAQKQKQADLNLEAQKQKQAADLELEEEKKKREQTDQAGAALDALVDAADEALFGARENEAASPTNAPQQQPASLSTKNFVIQFGGQQPRQQPPPSSRGMPPPPDDSFSNGGDYSDEGDLSTLHTLDQQGHGAEMVWCGGLF